MTDEQNTTPLWKDRVRDEVNPLGAGRQRKADWTHSVLKYVKPYIQRAGWRTTSVCREIIDCLRLMAERHEEVQRVIDVWDRFDYKKKTRIFSIDEACYDAQADRDEFAGLVLAAVGKHIERNCIAVIDRNFEKIIQATVDHAITGGPAGQKERLEMIRILTRNTRPAKADVPEKKSKDAAPVEGDTTQAKSLDAQMAELDAIED